MHYKDFQLINAAKTENIGRILDLISDGANINARDHYGETPLQWAVIGKCMESIKILLAHGADPNIKNRNGQTALLRACFNSNLAAMKILLEHGSDPNTEVPICDEVSADSPLRECAYNGFLDGVRLLLEYGAIVDADNEVQPSALVQSAMSGHDDVAWLLMEKGADLEKWRIIAASMDSNGNKNGGH